MNWLAFAVRDPLVKPEALARLARSLGIAATTPRGEADRRALARAVAKTILRGTGGQQP